LDDLIIGAHQSDLSGKLAAGKSYVVFLFGCLRPVFCSQFLPVSLICPFLIDARSVFSKVYLSYKEIVENLFDHSSPQLALKHT
jgi:hypothetical protein